MAKRTFNIAHRGFSGHYPENTLIAFRMAAQAGADMVELDVSNSQDMEIVVIHDDTLDRTTGGTGLVSQHTLAQLKALDAGAWLAPEFAGERLPTLTEVFQALAGTSVKFCVEIKKLDDGVPVLEVVERIIRLIDDNAMSSRSILIGFEADYLALAKQIEPLISTGYNPGHYEGKTAWEVVQSTLAITADLLIPYHEWLTSAFVEELQAHGIPLWNWTVNEPEDMRRALDMGVDGIITNYPDRLKVIFDNY